MSEEPIVCSNCKGVFGEDDYNFEYDLCHKCTNEVNENTKEARRSMIDFQFQFCPHCGKSIKITHQSSILYVDKPTSEELKKYEIFESTDEWLETQKTRTQEGQS